jgi:hypothetical protein
VSNRLRIEIVDAITYQYVMWFSLVYFALRNVGNAVDNGEISGRGVVYTAIFALLGAWHFFEWRRKRAALRDGDEA